MNTATYALNTARPKLQRQILTPEGVPLNVELATVGDRFGALILDLFFMILGFIALAFLGYYAFSLSDESAVTQSLAQSAFFLIAFFIRSFYFIFFELRWHGQTPGKRIVGLRVINRRGGPLRADAIFARNMMREIELFLPITAIIQLTMLIVSQWSVLFMCIWMLILAFLPVFNRDKMRAGDMVGGTWVVQAPKQVLQKDLAAIGGPGNGPFEQNSRYQFTTEQLDAYGIFELQTLETVLRRQTKGNDDTLREVAERIAKKIIWTSYLSRSDRRPFLNAYYTALRQHLEGKALFGDRKTDKHDTTGRPIGPRA